MVPYIDDSPRDSRTPVLAAFEIMDQVEDIWVAIAPNGTPEAFDSQIAEPFHNEDGLLGARESAYESLTGLTAQERASWPTIEYPLCIAYGYAVLVRLVAAARAHDLAWSYVEDASYWLGHCVALIKFGAESEVSLRETVTKAASARNAENRAIQRSAFEWLEDNFADCRSMDDAAERLLKVVPVAFRTARRYVKNWSMSRPSAC